MHEQLIAFFQGVPAWLATFLMSMLPVGELRLSIPVGVTVYGLPVWGVVFLSIIGNMVPVMILLALYGPLSEWLSKKSVFFERIFMKLFDITKRRHKEKFQKWGAAALILFVAIPIPITGAWTGSIAAFVFGIPYKPALGYIFLGVCIASVIVTILTLAGGVAYEALL